MERYTVTATSNGRLPRRPILEAEQSTPLPYSSFPPLKPQLRDPSFSTYLRPEEPKPPVLQQNPIINRQLADEKEISIFDAERYFNEGQEQQKQSNNTNASPVPAYLDRIVESYDIPAIRRFSSASYGRNYRTSSFHATPTASSEASWNSQSGLLSNPPGSIAVSMRNIRLDDKKKSSWFFRRKCPCSGKKSVQVEEKFSEPKTPSSNGYLNPKKQRSKSGEAGLEKAPTSELFEKRMGGVDERAKAKSISAPNAFSPEAHFTAEIGHRVVSSSRSFNDGGGFSFPILNPPAAGKLLLNSTTSNGAKQEMSQLEDPPRESLEVFRPSSEDTMGRTFNFPASPRSRPAPDDDIVSDASSDLFEIESFSTQSTMYPMYRRRETLDETSSFEGRSQFVGNELTGILNFRRSLDETTVTTTPTECYEPSEASIEWSVTTAEGFDRSSVTNMSISASDFEDVRCSQAAPAEATPRKAGRRKGNGLLSCRCEKAVYVGPHPVRHLTDQRRFGSPFAVESAARIQAAAPSSARSHSARISTR